MELPSTSTAHTPIKPTKPIHGSRGKAARRAFKIFIFATLEVALVGGVAAGTYYYGLDQGKTQGETLARLATAVTPLQIPSGATIISQCAVGRGTQYVLPSNIPHGPVFNVWQGKVIGLEYMIGNDDLANNKSFFGLPLYGNSYDHLNIGLQSAGHAGYPEPHYHVDIYNVSAAASAAITCK